MKSISAHVTIVIVVIAGVQGLPHNSKFDLKQSGDFALSAGGSILSGAPPTVSTSGNDGWLPFLLPLSYFMPTVNIAGLFNVTGSLDLDGDRRKTGNEPVIENGGTSESYGDMSQNYVFVLVPEGVKEKILAMRPQPQELQLEVLKD